MAQIKLLVEEQGEAQKDFITRFNERALKHDKELGEFRERLEEIESKRSSPGRTVSSNSVAREHRQLFDAWLRKPGDSARELKLRNFEEAEFKDVTIGTGAAGGFAVPEEISREIGLLERKFSPVRDLVKVVRASTSDFKMLVDKTGATSGWVAETGTRTATATPTLRERVPSHGELYAYPQASEWSFGRCLLRRRRLVGGQRGERVREADRHRCHFGQRHQQAHGPVEHRAGEYRGLRVARAQRQRAPVHHVGFDAGRRRDRTRRVARFGAHSA
jgi:predicted phage gp36 major capsid-like protein